jgi:hypothetical protein
MQRVVLAACLLVVTARAARGDVQQWTELGISTSLSKRWTLAFDQHLRFDQDISRVDSVMPEAAATYRVRKWLRVGAGYRLQYTRDGDDELVLRHRFHALVRARYDLGDVRLQYRIQYQEQLRPDAKDEHRHTLRNRIEATYRHFEQWSPGASFETFHAIDKGDLVHTDKLRIKAGLEHDRNHWALELYYCAELPVEDAFDPVRHIVGVGVHYDL